MTHVLYLKAEVVWRETSFTVWCSTCGTWNCQVQGVDYRLEPDPDAFQVQGSLQIREGLS